MNNEIGRKLTSLTLMTIMFAGGMTFAAPGFMPVQEAHAANANLFVSAENSQFDNYMSGPQVIEVVIINPEISDTDEAKGEPDVTVNGKKLRMAQATDGNWYGYFADRKQAIIADKTVADAFASGAGLDFGTFCSPGSAGTAIGAGFTETVGVAVPSTDGDNGGSGGALVSGTQISTVCADGGAATTDATLINVVREQKDLNGINAANGGPGPAGQIGIDTEGETEQNWPFVQLYNLNPTGNVNISYNKGGGVQSTTLTFDTVDQFAGLELDRAKYPRNALVHATITDLWLNIDPTDEDSWTFGTNSSDSTKGTYYQVFDENGGGAGTEVVNGTININSVLSDLMCEDNCVLLLDEDTQNTGKPVLTIQDNDDSIIGIAGDGDITNPANAQVEDEAGAAVAALGTNSMPITITEQGPTSGIFGTYDEGDKSTIQINPGAERGTSASIDYNETPQTVLIGFGFASIDIQPVDDEWSSGEEIPVVLVDSDANKNTRVDEDLDLNNPDNDIIPALRTGDPFTLRESGSSTGAEASWVAVPGSAAVTTGQSGNFTLTLGGLNITEDTTVQRFSDRAVISQNTTTATSSLGLVVDIGVNGEDFLQTFQDPFNINGDSDFRGLNLFNYDIRSLTGSSNATTGTGLQIFLVVNPSGGAIVDPTTKAITSPLQGISIANVTSFQGLVSLNSTSSQVANATAIHELVHSDTIGISDDARIGLFFDFATPVTVDTIDDNPIVADFFSFGFIGDGTREDQRVSNQIVRIEAEETGDNTGTFEGSLEYFLVNQLNILDEPLFTGLSTIADDPSFVVFDDLDDEDAPRVNYNDLGQDGSITPVADQEDAPTHSGVVSFDANTYKRGDTVTVTLEDADLNTDSDLIDIFTTVTTLPADGDASGVIGDTAGEVVDPAFDTIGEAGLPTATKVDGTPFSFGPLGRLLDITFDDEQWAQSNVRIGGVSCGATPTPAFNNGPSAATFSLVETGKGTGVFVGDFLIPDQYCARSGASGDNGVVRTVTGVDMEVNYLDFRDASGEVIEVGDSAGVRANTGSVSLDRTVYPVPWGVVADFGGDTGSNLANGVSVFPVHATGVTGTVDTNGETLGQGDLLVHIRVNDPDFDVSPGGEDVIAEDTDKAVGPIKVTITRGAKQMVLGYAGGSTPNTKGVIDVGGNGVFGCAAADVGANGICDAAERTLFFNDLDGDRIFDPGDSPPEKEIRQFGAIKEIAPDAGIFEQDLVIRYTDGPASPICPATDSFKPLDGTARTSGNTLARFDTTPANAGENFCILQGDIITVEYTDPTDASGDPNTVTDSATFDLRNGVLQSDKSVYIIGSDAILTVIDPDWDLDNDQAETYDLDILEWDSDAATLTMGNLGGEPGAFDPEPTDFRETGDSTGIFQIVVEIPEELAGDRLERGEEVILEYTDWGPSGADFVGQEEEDINLTIFTSNFGATVELDQKVYSWTDKVYVTIVAPDHNFDSDLVDEIGDTSLDPVKVATRGAKLNNYKLVETGTDTGIFTGEVILTGFKSHDADGDGDTGDASGITGNSVGEKATGPTDGFLSADDDDGITVSFEFSEDETVVGSALIRWNIGEVQFLEASYPATGTGVVRVVDPDMNLNPESVDNFNVDVWSDSDSGGIDLTVTETNEATGIFEGTVFFTTTDESSGHRLRVSEGDTITAEYEDNTLPDPYTTADELDVTATSIIGTIVPPLERAPAANARVVDAFGNTLDTVSVDQQVQITADLANGQDREQAFAYLVQVQDSNGVTVSLAWITGSLSPGQSFSPALSWIPQQAGTYTATVFVWESVDNPTALSPPVETTINVQ